MNVRLAALALGVLPVLALQDKKEEAPRVPDVGKPAPTFRLYDHNGRGGWVLLSKCGVAW